MSREVDAGAQLAASDPELKAGLASLGVPRLERCVRGDRHDVRAQQRGLRGSGICFGRGKGAVGPVLCIEVCVAQVALVFRLALRRGVEGIRAPRGRVDPP